MGLPGLEQVVDFGKQVGGMLRDFGAGAEQGLGLQKALGMTLGMAQPSQQQQPQGEGPEGLLNRPGASGPENLSDYHGLLPNLLLRIGNAGEELEGRTSVSDSIRGQRRAANDRQQEGIKQALELAREFGGVIDKTPQDRLSTVSGLLRKRYSEVAGPGGEHFYDALVGDGANWFGNTEEAATDPTLHALIANPNSTPEMVKEYMKSEHFQQRRDQAQDSKLLAPARAKIDAQRTSANPAYRAAWEEAGKDGTVTLDDVIGFQPLLAEADRLTNTDIATLRRNESALTDVPGMRMREEVIAKRAGDEAAGRAKTLQQQKDDAALERQHAADAAALERVKARPPTGLPRTPRGLTPYQELAEGRFQDSLTTPYGKARTPKAAGELNKIYRASRELESAFDTMISIRKEYGPEISNREVVAKAQEAAANAKLAAKELANLGVLSKPDYEFLQRMVPDDPTQFDWVPFQDPVMAKMLAAQKRNQEREQIGMQTYLAPESGGATSAGADAAPGGAPSGAAPGMGAPPESAGGQDWKTDPRVRQLTEWLSSKQITPEQARVQLERIRDEYMSFDQAEGAMDGR